MPQSEDNKVWFPVLCAMLVFAAGMLVFSVATKDWFWVPVWSAFTTYWAVRIWQVTHED